MKYLGFFALGLGLLAGCSASSAQSQKALAPTDVVATVGTSRITLEEVDDRALQQSASDFGSVKLGQALYNARRSALDDIVANRLFDDEAKSQHVDRSALIEKEITSKIPAVTDTEITDWYQANKSRVQGASLDQVRTPIRNYLTQERMQTVRAQYIASLKQKTPVRIMLEPPRQRFAANVSPARGSDKAPIEIVEFSDFQCPFCLRAFPTVQQVLSTYGDRVHLVYRHFPLPNHPNARPAAEAAACAAEQDKFWAFHDKLFADQSHLADADLKQDAAALGLDTAKFAACVDGHKTKAKVDEDLEAGRDAGVDGTPAFFINGRAVSGAQPFDMFKRIIDEELELKNSR